MTQRVAITGASGLIGGALSSFLTARGDTVVHLVRRPARTMGEVEWTPGAPLAGEALGDANAVVHLAGAGVGDRRWTAERRAEIRRSRIDGTRTIARALAGLDRPVRLVSASAIGIYGDDRGEEVLTEESPRGTGFLAEVCESWETETRPAADAGHPVAMARTGIVLSARGGAIAKVLPLARAGLAGPLGDGTQFWAWIALVDEVRALAWLVDHPKITGPVNLTAPNPARQADVMRALAEVLGRPSPRLRVPAMPIRAALGGMSTEVLGSRHVLPEVLTRSGFAFQVPDVQTAVRLAVEGG